MGSRLIFFNELIWGDWMSEFDSQYDRVTKLFTLGEPDKISFAIPRGSNFEHPLVKAYRENIEFLFDIGDGKRIDRR